MKNLWIEEVSKHQNLGDSTEFRVCELHFTENDYQNKRDKPGGKRILKNDVVPSIFPVEKTKNQVESVHRNSSYKRPIIKRYCKIKYCTNETGTSNGDVVFGRYESNPMNYIGLTSFTYTRSLIIAYY